MSFSSDRVVVPFSAFLERRQQLEARATASRQPNPDDPNSNRRGTDESDSSDVRDRPGPDVPQSSRRAPLASSKT